MEEELQERIEDVAPELELGGREGEGIGVGRSGGGGGWEKDGREKKGKSCNAVINQVLLVSSRLLFRLCFTIVQQNTEGTWERGLGLRTFE